MAGTYLGTRLSADQIRTQSQDLSPKFSLDELKIALGIGADGKGPDWSFAGDKWSDKMASIPSGWEWDEANQEFKKTRKPLMEELGGGSLIDEPFRFIALPFLEYFLQQRAELYNKLDISSGITNYVDYGKRMLTTSEDAIRIFLLMKGLTGLGSGLGGRSEELAKAYSQPASGGEPQAYQQTGTSEEEPGKSILQNYSSTGSTDQKIAELRKALDQLRYHMDMQYAYDKNRFETARAERKRYGALGGVVAGDLAGDVIEPSLSYDDLL